MSDSLIKPMLAVDAKKIASRNASIPEEEAGWTMEPKLNGWRFIFVVADDGVHAYGGRNGADHTNDVGIQPQLQALSNLPSGTVLDSELVVDGGSAPNVSSYLAGTDRGKQLTAKVWVFDLLHHGGDDLTGLRWKERRRQLVELSEGFDPDNVVLVPTCPPSQLVHDAWLAAGMEGSVLKRVNGLYRPGSRTTEWLKFKPQETTEAVMIGFEMGRGKYNRHVVSSIDVRLVETDVVTSTAIEFETVEEAQEMVGKMLTLRHHGWTKDGSISHPIFDCWRPDRDPVPA